MDRVVEILSGTSLVYLGFIASLAAGVATGVGALPVLFVRNISQRLQDAMLGFGAGVMLAATSFSLIVPGIEAAHTTYGSEPGAALIIGVGMFIGGFFLWLSDKYSPHEHFISGPEGADPKNLKRVWLFIIAITLHNFPEGLAVGVGFGSGDIANGVALAVGIGLQNLPEGLVVAIALIGERYSISRALFIALLTGLVEPIGGVIGAGVVSIAAPLLPWGLGFAAGAMLFVISDEIIPESHRKGFEKEATIGVMIGFVVMMFLDVTLG
ncbi:MAG: ZIP family metal transporter [Proteobacteria bacterium]|nr:ZIP family metal transporter [Pseudomonadota bacterium]